MKIKRGYLINYLIKKYNYQSYLEIGCDTNETFNSIHIKRVGVDPERGGTIRKTSDQYFETCNENFDIIFVDGLHLYEQAKKDVLNSLQHLNQGGIIIMHDCNPPEEKCQVRKFINGTAWNGDVWKALVEFKESNPNNVFVLDEDWGLGIVIPPITLKYSNINYADLPYQLLERNRKNMLGLKNWDEIIEIIDELFLTKK
jgi:hypothetical protein